MKNLNQKQKKNLLIGGLLAVVLLMIVGYAAFATSLQINGTANIDSNFCIGFNTTATNNVSTTTGVTGGSSPNGSITYSGNACQTNYKTGASLNTTLNQPGDKVTYTLTIANKGNLNAAIESIQVGENTVTKNQTITVGNVIYKINMPESTTLAANASTTMQVSAEFQNTTNIGNGYSGETQSINVKINAVQSNGSNGMVVTPDTYSGTIYAYNPGYNDAETGDYIGDAYQIGESIEGKDYTKNRSEITNSYFLKHEVENDLVTASYVCFVMNGIDKCMQGGDGGAAFATNTAIIQSYKQHYSLGNLDDSTHTGCYFFGSRSSCIGGGFRSVYSDSDGNVDVYGSDSEGCYVGGGGHSGCNE